MLRLEWTQPAADALDAAQTYYHELNPKVASALARRVLDAAMRLQEHPHLGRPGLRQGTREWVVSRTPYLLVYRETDESIQILHVWNAVQDWQNQLDERN